MRSIPVLRGVGRNRLVMKAFLYSCAFCACATVTRTEDRAGTGGSGIPPGAAAPDGRPDGFDAHDFDFLIGEWDMVNRRLAHRGVGSHEWVEFPSRLRNVQYLNGLANLDDTQFPNGITGKNDGPFSGLAVRTFDLKKKTWSIYWVSGKSGCCLTDPEVGGFKGDRGEFYGTDTDNGRPVKVRYVWTRLGPDKAHWDQSFDYGDGKWEMNWENTVTRRH